MYGLRFLVLMFMLLATPARAIDSAAVNRTSWVSA